MNEASTMRGWQASLALEYQFRDGRTRLVARKRRGPLAVQRSFYPEGEPCHNYILHPPGGVVGGDELVLDIRAGSDSHALLTTPGATKFYRAGEDRSAHQIQRLTVAAGATLEFLPQPNIFFDGAKVSLETEICIAAGGRFIGWEVNCLGRPSSGEAYSQGLLGSRTTVTIADKLRLLESFRSHGGSAQASAAGLRGYACQGCLVVAPCDTTVKAALEQILLNEMPEVAARSVVGGLTLVDEVLVVRVLAQQSEPVLGLFTTLWQSLRQVYLSRTACPPRIWAT